jgi:hypothetical protein
MYMDAPTTMVKPLMTHYWRVPDVNDACPEWKKTAEQAGTYKNWGGCTKMGSDSLNGRSTVKYEVSQPRARRVIYGWTRNCAVS